MIAGQFSRGREEFYYETIALLILVGKRLGQCPSRKHRRSTKCEALFDFDRVFFVFTSIGTEKGRHLKGAPQPFGEAVAPNPPPDPPLVSTYQR